MNKKQKCCICNKGFTGWGNNPEGYVDPLTMKLGNFNPEDRCCDKCNERVIAGRMLGLVAMKTVRKLGTRDITIGTEKLNSLIAEGDIRPVTRDFIVANWNDIV